MERLERLGNRWVRWGQNTGDLARQARDVLPQGLKFSSRASDKFSRVSESGAGCRASQARSSICSLLSLGTTRTYRSQPLRRTTVSLSSPS